MYFTAVPAMSTVLSDQKQPNGGAQAAGWSGLARSILRRIASIFGGGSEDRLYAQSAKQYLIALTSTHFSLTSRKEALSTSASSAELKRILGKYQEDATIEDDIAAWDDAHRCERLLVDLYDADRLDIELDRRILEAKKDALDYAGFFESRRTMSPPAGAPAPKDPTAANRALLAKLIEDQQWYNTKMYLKRGYAHGAQKRVFKAFIAAFLIFIVTMFVVFESRDASKYLVAKPDAAAATPASPAGAAANGG